MYSVLLLSLCVMFVVILSSLFFLKHAKSNTQFASFSLLLMFSHDSTQTRSFPPLYQIYFSFRCLSTLKELECTIPSPCTPTKGSFLHLFTFSVSSFL